ncbi:MAG: thymidylate synthase [Candidatus Jordarchaeales archaeon]
MKPYGPYVIRARHVDAAWRQANRLILEKGIPVTTEDKRQETLETIGCVIHLTAWRSGPILPRGYIGMDEKTLKESYIPQYLTAEKGGHTYTYGWCARKRFGVNQVVKAGEALKRSDTALIQFWNPASDTSNPNPPCISMIILHRFGDTVNAIAYIRSNDMARAWPEDVAGINMAFLTEAASHIKGVESVGTTTTISASAHIYKTAEEELKSALSQTTTPTTGGKRKTTGGPVIVEAATVKDAASRAKKAAEKYPEPLYLVLKIHKPEPFQPDQELVEELENYEGTTDLGEKVTVNQLQYATEKTATTPESRRILVTPCNPKTGKQANPLLLQFLPRMRENHTIALYTNISLDEITQQIAKAAGIQKIVSEKAHTPQGPLTAIITPLKPH